MIARALDAGVPCAWVLGDEVYGADRRLRAMLEERGRPYVLAIRSNDRLDADLEGGVGRDTPGALTRALPPPARRRRSAGPGTKGEGPFGRARPGPGPPPGSGGRAPPPRGGSGLGPGAGPRGERGCGGARRRVAPRREAGGAAPPRERWLLLRRSTADPADLAYFAVFAPAGSRLLDLARAAGRRWLVEECFEAAKQEVGLADYEVRSWRGWHRHVPLAMLALALLAGLRAALNAAKGGGAPPASFSCPSASLNSAA